MTTQPELLTYEEAGKVLSVDARTIRRLVDAGQLAAVRVTRRTPRIHRNELERFIETRPDV